MMINCRLSKLTVSSSSLIRADIAFCYFLALNLILNGFVKYKCALKRVSSTTLLIWINCRCVHCFLFESQTVHFITGDRLLNVNSVQLIVKAPHFIARSKVSHSSCVLDLFMFLYIYGECSLWINCDCAKLTVFCLTLCLRLWSSFVLCSSIVCCSTHIV